MQRIQTVCGVMNLFLTRAVRMVFIFIDYIHICRSKLGIKNFKHKFDINVDRMAGQVSHNGNPDQHRF